MIFLLTGIAGAWFSFQPDPPAAVAERIATRIGDELHRIDEQAPGIIAGVGTPGLITDVSYPFFVYDGDSLLYWSDNQFVPTPPMVSDDFSVKLIKTGTEAFLAKKIRVNNDRYVVVLVLLQRNYIINNAYLNPEWNERIFATGNFVIHEPYSPIGVPVCLPDHCLFSISFHTEGFPTNSSLRTLSTVLLFLALGFLIAWAGGRIVVVGRRWPEVAFGMMIVGWWAIRWAMTATGFPHDFVQSNLFDPQFFASSALNSSMGDLLINTLAVLVICYYVFKNYFRFRITQWRKAPVWRWPVMVFCGLCILFSGLFPFVVIQTISNNSSLALDISQSLAFSPLRAVAFAVVLLSGICAFFFAHAFIRILAADSSTLRPVLAFVLAAGIFVLINEVTAQRYGAALVITSGYFGSVLFLRLYGSLKRLSFNTFAYLFVGVFCFSLIGGFGVDHFSRKEKIESQFRFANNFLIDRDIFGEFLLAETANKIANDAFTQTRMTSPFLNKDAIGQKIRQFFLPSYFNKYEVEIYMFNALGQPLSDNTNSDMKDMVSRYEADPFSTQYEGIYFVNNPASDVTQKYVVVVPIERLNAPAGSVVVELSLKKVIPESVYPELLVDYGFQQFYRTQDLSYALYANGRLVFTSGDFNYQKFFDRSWLGNISLYTEGVSFHAFDHIAQEDNNNRVAVVSTPRSPLDYRIANFSFLFVLGLFIILSMIFVQGLYNYLKGRRLFFSARIQLYLNLAFFIPLIIVSVTTLGLTSKASQQQLDAEYLNKSRVFGEEIISSLTAYLSGNEPSAEPFTSRLTELAHLSNVDANIYTPDGRLLATSQPKIFESNLLSPYINPTAFERIAGGETALIESERVGDLHYFVAYASLNSSQTGELNGILGIPFFQSAYYLEKAQIVMLTNILNIFAVIFIILLTLSYFVSEWLTFPLQFITQSLRKTTLTKVNQPLKWNADDEIGLMVKEYNTMLYKLSESKDELEQTQREKAWREIAQQVAHEIKNPLTPMKLTLQQLERALQAGEQSPEKTRKAITALLSQVDALNGIASSFSGFAKMPEPVIRRLDLVTALQRTVDLHKTSADIQFKPEAQNVAVMGDEQMLSRTFSNLILNGMQAGIPGQRVRIHVTLRIQNGKARIEFRDNGRGIDPAIADRIFLPHFSTKKSGSGLGLAIARQGLEQMKGRMWFESKGSHGTSFFVEIPLEH